MAAKWDRSLLDRDWQRDYLSTAAMYGGPVSGDGGSFELRRVGVDAASLRRGGYSAMELLAGGYTEGEITAAGYTPLELSKGKK